MLFLFVPQESWDLQLWMFGYITCGFPRIFGYVLQVIKYSISIPLDRGGFGGWNPNADRQQELLSWGYKCSRNAQLCMEVPVVEHQDQAKIIPELCPIHPKYSPEFWEWQKGIFPGCQSSTQEAWEESRGRSGQTSSPTTNYLLNQACPEEEIDGNTRVALHWTLERKGGEERQTITKWKESWKPGTTHDINI